MAHRASVAVTRGERDQLHGSRFRALQYVGRFIIPKAACGYMVYTWDLKGLVIILGPMHIP